MADRPLHEYERTFTDEQLDTIARLHAEGQSNRAIGRALGITDGRVKTALKRLDVIEAAERLRATDLVPASLMTMVRLQEQSTDLLVHMEQRMTQLEGQMRKMNRAIHVQAVVSTRRRETIKTMRAEMDELRKIIRQRGLTS